MTHEVMVGCIKVLEGLFVAGIVGSFILICLTSIEDFREVFQRESNQEPGAMSD